MGNPDWASFIRFLATSSTMLGRAVVAERKVEQRLRTSMVCVCTFRRVLRLACATVLAWSAGAEAASISHQLAHEADLLQLQKAG
jgi:hypothetical protein